MRTEGFSSALLSTLIVLSLIAPVAVLHLSSTAQVAAQAEPAIIIQGSSTAYNRNRTGVEPWRYYLPGDQPPIMAAKRVGSGAVVAAGTAATCRNGRWTAGEWDVLLDKAFQWMVPGATKVLWYEGYGVYNNTTRCSDLKAALEAKGYTVTGDSTEPITPSLLAPYDILVIPQLEKGDGGLGGDPSLLPDADVAAIKNFVEGGKGLLIMDQSDYQTYNYYLVHNKILKALDFGIYFQSDEVDETGDVYQFDALVTSAHFGADYQAATGKTTVRVYSVCSLAIQVDYAVTIVATPSYRDGFPGSSVSCSLRVTNMGLNPDNYDLLLEDNLGWPMQLSESFLSLPSGTSATVTLTVDIPTTAVYRIYDNITVTAQSRTRAEVKSRTTVIVYPSTWLMPPKDDSEVAENRPTYNTGTSSSMHVGSSKTGAYGNQRVFIKFDLGQGLPAGASITGARLYLYCYRIRVAENLYDGPLPPWISPKVVEVYGVDDDTWSEGTINWSNQPPTAESALDNEAVDAALKWYSWDVTSFVADQREGGDNIVSLCLKAAVENLEFPENFALSFDSKEYGDVGFHPYLAIGYRMEVEPSPTYRDGLPGGTVTFDVVVWNRGAAVDNYTLSATDDAGWTLTFDSNQILDLAPNESATRKLTVTIPSSAADSTIDNITITVTSDGDLNMYDNYRVTVHAGRRLRPPVADAYVAEGWPDNNFGSRNYLDIWSSPNPPDNKNIYWNKRIFLKFDLSNGIPAGASIENARLRLYNFAGFNANLDVQIYSVSDDSWLENEITWRNQPALGSLLSTTTLKVGENEMWYEWDITDFVKNQFLGDKVVSLCLKAAVENMSENARFRFESKEWGTIWQHPYIWIKLTGDTAGVTASVSPFIQSALAGENLRYEVTITNTGNVGDIVNLSASSDRGWSTSLQRQISLAAGESRTENLIVVIPPGTTPSTVSTVTVTALSMNDNTKSSSPTCQAHTGKAKFTLENLYKVSLDFDFWIVTGDTIVAKFYTYTGTYQAEQIFWSGTPPEHVVKFENIPHPQGKAVERLVLVGENRTLATWVTVRSALLGRVSKIKSAWPYAGTATRSAFLGEVSGIKSKWPYAPS